jgi:flagellar motor protein MotB
MKSTRLLKKKAYYDEEIDSEGSWALSYGDMITLLLSFFVIFFTHDPKQQKLEKMNRHLSFQIENLVPAVAPVSLQEGKGGKVNLPALSGLEMRAHSIEDNIVVTFQATSFFNSGSVTVSSLGEKLLKEFGEKYLPYAGNYRLAIKGFTDKRKVRKLSSRKYGDNLELSALRSLAAMRVLQQSGIPLNRMEIAGSGELELIDKVLPRSEGLTQSELEAYSRTVVLVIEPIKESW